MQEASLKKAKHKVFFLSLETIYIYTAVNKTRCKFPLWLVFCYNSMHFSLDTSSVLCTEFLSNKNIDKNYFFETFYLLYVMCIEKYITTTATPSLTRILGH